MTVITCCGLRGEIRKKGLAENGKGRWMIMEEQMFFLARLNNKHLLNDFLHISDYKKASGIHTENYVEVGGKVKFLPYSLVSEFKYRRKQLMLFFLFMSNKSAKIKA